MTQQHKKIFIIAAGFIFYFFDRLIKYLVFNKIIADSFFINYATNRGIAFGLTLPKAFLFFLIFFVILFFMGLLIAAWRRNNFNQITSYALITLGASSNFLDRLKFGFVIDYLDVHFWPVFNLGDAMIVLGVAIMVIKALKHSNKNFSI